MRIQSQPPSGPRPHHAWATTPPLGWCSADGSSSATNEAFVRANAAFLAEHCVRLGWKYVVVGPGWYCEDGTDAGVNVDQWGRPLPAVARFPSAKRGAGFAALARHVHELGLRFGVHLSRGIARSAVERQLPIKGTDVDAAHIADLSRCSARDPKMLTIDTRKRGAQAYYDSVFELFAAWGVDYVELDDVTGSYEDYAAELEVIREAVDKAGRPLLLGVSPAAPVIDAAAHLRAYANLWQVGAGVWNDWDAIRRQFAELGRWREHAGPGWPGPGLLQLGSRDTTTPACQASPEELRSFVSFCCIARAPLFVTGDLCSLDAATQALLTNPELLTLGRNATSSRVLYERKGIIAWVADVPNSEDKYIALFNTRDPRPLTPETRLFEGSLALAGARNALQALEVELALPPADTLLLRVDTEAWPAAFAVWGEPRLLMDDGQELPLTDLPWTRAGARGGTVRVHRDEGAGPLIVAGDELQDGFVAPAPCVLEFRLPAGVKGFSAVCGTLAEIGSVEGQHPLAFSVHAFMSDSGSPKPSLPITITKAELGLAGPMWVRDLWQREELGLFPSEFSAQIPWHGVGVYRVSEGG